MTVAVIVDESAAGAPCFARACDAGFLADVGECSVAIVVIKDILAVVSDVQILETIVVIVADTGALAPASVREAGFLSDIGEGAVVVVAVEMICGSFVCSEAAVELCAVDDEDIGPAVVIVVEDRDASAGGFDDVFFRGDAAEGVGHCEAGSFCDVYEIRERLGSGSCALGIVDSKKQRNREKNGASEAKCRRNHTPLTKSIKNHAVKG
jgi:hypothetical protein